MKLQQLTHVLNDYPHEALPLGFTAPIGSDKSTQPNVLYCYSVGENDPNDYLYRFDCDSYIGHAQLFCHRYKIIRHTRKGAWIDAGKEKFVLLGARKKFAYETIEEALESFIARKNRQIEILEAQLVTAKEGIAIAVQHKETKP